MKKMFFLIAAGALFLLRSHAQSIAINSDGSLANRHAIVDVKSSTKGVLIPRMSTAALEAIPNTRGLMVFDTTTNSIWINTGLEWQDIGKASKGNGWLLTGNSNTNDKTNFIGTTNDVPLTFKVNNQYSGRIDSNRMNTFLGFRTGGLSLGGLANTVMGFKAHFSNTLCGEITSYGAQTLYNNTEGHKNTANVNATLFLNTTGSFNTGTGNLALFSNVSGGENTADGFEALNLNTTGSNNTAQGSGALSLNHTGSFLTGIGDNANVGADGLVNSTAVGANARINSSNTIQLGDPNIISVNSYGTFTTISDGRFKVEIRNDVGGLNFIMKLRPVTYQLDERKIAIEQYGENNNRMVTQKLQTENSNLNIRHTGFIAQEVEKAANETGFEFDAIKKPENDKDHYSLGYAQFVVPLVKAVQEQQQLINAQDQRMLEQDYKIRALENELAEIKKLLSTNH